MRQLKTLALAVSATMAAAVVMTSPHSQAQDRRGQSATPVAESSPTTQFATHLEVQSKQDLIAAMHPGVRIGTWGGSSRVYGNQFSFGATPQASAENFRQNLLPTLGIAANEVQPYADFLNNGRAGENTLQLMYDAATDSYKFTAVYFTQVRDGLEVYGSRLTLLTRNVANYPMVMAGVHLRDLGGFQVDPALKTRPNIDKSLENARATIGHDTQILSEPRVVIWAGVDDQVVQPAVAVEFMAEGGDYVQGTYKALRFFTDARTGAVLHTESLIHDVDVSGNVSGMATTGVMADTCEGIAPMPMPYARVAIGANFVFADANGNFTIPNAGNTPVAVDAEVRGQYFRVVNTATPGGGNSTLSQVVNPPGPADFMFNAANDSQFKRAEVNAYIQANRVRDYILQYHPTYPTVHAETNFLTNVNINQTCNAFYSSANQSINFYIAGGGCTNTANSTVVHHEYGHRLINAAGSGQGAYGEGMSDCMAVIVTDQPCLGGGFNQPCGASNPCLRRADNDCQYSAGNCSSCGSAIHTCGQLISGCVWSTRNYLAAVYPATYRDIISSLTVNSVPLHTGTLINPQITIDFLTLDDDDGNLANGTPHYNQINAGFTDHGMPGPPVTNAILVTPATGPTHEGVVGGPFTNNPFNYTMENNTNVPANYTISVNPGGTAPLLINGQTPPINGTMAGNEVLNMPISVAPAANSLPAGIYMSTVKIQDTTNNVNYDLVHKLEIGQVAYSVTPAHGLVSGGPVGGPFNATQAYTVTSTKPTPVTVRVAAGANWISLNGGSGPVDLSLSGIGDSEVITVGFSGAANSLPAGEVSSSVTFTNIGDGGNASDTSRPVVLDVGRFTYASTDTPIAICDNCQNIVSVITVPDSYCVGDVDVQVDITHTYIGDLIVEVISPQGTVVRLHNRTGGSTGNIHKLYSDEGPNVPDGPGALSDFDGVVVAGQWKLRVSDNAAQDIGTIDSWQLKIASGGDVCPPVANDITVSVPVLVTSNITLVASSSVGDLDYIITTLPGNGLLFDPNGGAINSVPYTLLSNGAIVRYKPDFDHAGPDSFTYKANDGQDSNQALVSITVGGPQMAHSFNLDTNPGWTMDSGWLFGPPCGCGTIAGRLDPAAAYSGENVFGYATGLYPNNLSPARYLTTNAINCANLTGAQLRFRRWLGVEATGSAGTWDHARIHVSTDGTNWTQVWANRNVTINEQAWTLQTVDIGAVADGSSTVYVRWQMGTTDGSVQYQGWNIDDVQIWGIRPPCPSDCTGDSMVNVADLLAVIQSWGACPTGCAGDIYPPGGDGVVNVGDLLAVIQSWGACP